MAVMKSYRIELWFNVPGRRAFINITPQVEEYLRESGIKEGFVLCWLNSQSISKEMINEGIFNRGNWLYRWFSRRTAHSTRP
jgi:thiamine phosphate synthase YjbQ (UPF0047 family)